MSKAKTIEFEYKDNKYVLEYNRESIRIMEKGGFDLQEFLKKPASNIDLAFQGAFLKNHRKIRASEIEEIFRLIKDKEQLTNTLIEMIQETYESLFETEESEDGKNIEWKMV